jgi:hypothetical protein
MIEDPMGESDNPSNRPYQEGDAKEQPSNERFHLYGLHGEYAQQIVPIPPTGLQIGRSKSNQLRLSEKSVSRQHAILLPSKSGIMIRDEGSSLGTMVNGRRISSPTELKPGDVIRIGYGQAFEFRTG